MTSFTTVPSRRLAAAASALTVVAVAVGVLVLVLGASLPESWWPRTGQAFTPDAATVGAHACDRIVGPAKAYCEHGRHATSAGPAQAGGDSSPWRLLPAATAVGALVIWRRRTHARQGRA